jgi:acyl carrier protein
MANQEIEKRLKAIIVAAKPQIKSEDIGKGFQLQEYNFDSIELMQLVVEIETEFDIEIGEEYFVNEILLDYDQLLGLIVNSLDK